MNISKTILLRPIPHSSRALQSGILIDILFSPPLSLSDVPFCAVHRKLDSNRSQFRWSTGKRWFRQFPKWTNLAGNARQGLLHHPGAQFRPVSARRNSRESFWLWWQHSWIMINLNCYPTPSFPPRKRQIPPSPDRSACSRYRIRRFAFWHIWWAHWNQSILCWNHPWRTRYRSSEPLRQNCWMKYNRATMPSAGCCWPTWSEAQVRLIWLENRNMWVAVNSDWIESH